MGGVDRIGHDALAAVALCDPATGSAYFAAADGRLSGADRQEHLDCFHHRLGGVDAGWQAGQQCYVSAVSGVPDCGRHLLHLVLSVVAHQFCFREEIPWPSLKSTTLPSALAAIRCSTVFRCPLNAVK